MNQINVLPLGQIKSFSLANYLYIVFFKNKYNAIFLYNYLRDMFYIKEDFTIEDFTIFKKTSLKEERYF